jgi:hypothetical protein
MLRQLLPLIAALLLLALPAPTGAQEDSETNCRAYAERAQAVVADQHNRGFDLESRNPARYTPYFEDHYNWCLALDNFAIAKREEEYRRFEVTTASICSAYATEAMEQLAQAFAQCGANPVSGAHWSVTDWGGHYNWCMYRGTSGGVDRYETHPEMDEARSLRRNDLLNC